MELASRTIRDLVLIAVGVLAYIDTPPSVQEAGIYGPLSKVWALMIGIGSPQEGSSRPSTFTRSTSTTSKPSASHAALAVALAVGQQQRALDFAPSTRRDADDSIHRTLSIIV